jgi:hypothetical protein
MQETISDRFPISADLCTRIDGARQKESGKQSIAIAKKKMFSQNNMKKNEGKFDEEKRLKLGIAL